jgi:hypothetical protein
MRNVFRFAPVLMGLLAMSSAYAEIVPAITITTDAYIGSTYVISVDRADSGEVTELTYKRDSGAIAKFSVEMLENAPQVLLNDEGRDIILLSLEKDFNARQGGHGIVRYLHNGATGNYKDFRILIDVQKDIVMRSDPNSSDPDSDKNGYTGAFNHIFMKKRTVLGKTIGIDHFEPSEK